MRYERTRFLRNVEQLLVLVEGLRTDTTVDQNTKDAAVRLLEEGNLASLGGTLSILCGVYEELAKMDAAPGGLGHLLGNVRTMQSLLVATEEDAADTALHKLKRNWKLQKGTRSGGDGKRGLCHLV